MSRLTSPKIDLFVTSLTHRSFDRQTFDHVKHHPGTAVNLI